jgi:zinc transport system permease protein
MTLLDNFLIRAALAGIGVALAAAPLGSFVVWRRMAYFGDATAHAAILGVALALALDTSVFATVLVVALAMDTLLGVIAHSSLAFGLVALAFLTNVRFDLSAWLFGDILAVTRGDLATIWGGAALVLGLLWWRWNALLTATLNADLAYASGLDPRREQLVLTLALALVVAVAIKVVGVLLIGAMLIIPAAAARPFATTPERMALISILIGMVSALGGLALAFRFDTPTGPTMVCLAAGLFAASALFRAVRPA